MSEELNQDYKCLVLFAALAGRPFTKSDLKVELSIRDLDKLTDETGLLKLTGKGRSRSIEANSETLRWAGEHLNTELEGKNKAVLMVLGLVRAKAAAFLSAKQISMAEFLKPTPERVAKVAEGGDTLEAVRRVYLELTGGAYEKRVLLKDLRKRLGFDREAQDAAFFKLLRSGEGDFYPEDDPMSRDEEDEQAALEVADRRRHLVYLHREPRA
jgi:hypothetical protein